MSLISNLTMYLLTSYNLSGIFVVNVVQIWNGSSNVASIVGAFISDAYLGRFRTLLFGSIASLLGILIMTLTAGIHQLRPPNCTDRPHCQWPQLWQLAVVFFALALLSVGAGGIRPCNIAFGADQFDTKTEKGRAQLESFFNWWYFTFTIALVIALTGVVYIQTNVSWTLGFAIPTLCLAFSITIFLIGRHTYIRKKPHGSVFSDMAKVITAACRKRKLKTSDRTLYYDPDPSESDYNNNVRLVRTDRFKFLDKAAIISDPSELNEQLMPKNKITKRATRLRMSLRIRIGIILSILCMLVAAIVEQKRRDSALRAKLFVSPMSFAVLLPQFALSGLNEAFAAVSIMEFFTLEMPESMRTVAGAVFFLSLSIANYLGSLIVNIVHKATSHGRRNSWLGGHDLNQSKLDYYYYLIAALGALNFLYFNFFASHFLGAKPSKDTKKVQSKNSIPSQQNGESSQEMEFDITIVPR
ncbi:hypothetical protein PIB30_020877 [Stylosanthes scabra]|uniref:Uncharacterized protein n=1 Tax=Stylosanthes scabra TaxID=79078 RepID=A0ABU6WBT1_9FABA|nr:hypothetical protein [Stylosanthes scabra]